METQLYTLLVILALAICTFYLFFKPKPSIFFALEPKIFALATCIFYLFFKPEPSIFAALEPKIFALATCIFYLFFKTKPSIFITTWHQKILALAICIFYLFFKTLPSVSARIVTSPGYLIMELPHIDCVSLKPTGVTWEGKYRLIEWIVKTYMLFSFTLHYIIPEFCLQAFLEDKICCKATEGSGQPATIAWRYFWRNFSWQ